MGLPNNIKKMRKEKKWSQAELASKIGTHLSHINRLETGKYNPSLDVLLKLSSVFEISLDLLVSGNGTPEEVRIEDQTFAEKIKLLNTFDADEKQAITLIIDAILTKKKMLNLLADVKIS